MVDVVQQVTAEVTTVKSKVKAWIAAHVPHAISAVVGYVVSHFSVISYLVHKVI
jgi:hypothetical protein